MGTIGRFSFVPQNLKGSIVGATGDGNDGMGFPLNQVYWQIIENQTAGGGSCNGPVLGVIAYDYINARWSCLFTKETGIMLHQSTTYVDEIGEIKAFMATLTAPQTVDEVGNDVAYGASIPPLHS
jgi:hypothetical protein